MPTNKFNFTRTRLEDLVNHHKNKRLLVHDTTQPGLAICVTSTGNKSFQLHYWDKQRRKSVVMTLGRFPSMLIGDARKKAAKLIVDIEDGIDVKQVAKSIKTETIFSDMFAEWLEKHAKPHKRSWLEDSRRYLLYMKKPFGNKPISWFTPDRIRKWHFDITQTPKQRGGETSLPNSVGNKTASVTYISGPTANRALALLSTVFNQMRSDAPNPCKGVKKFPEKSRSRFLQPGELKRFFKALDAPETPEIIRDYVYLSLFTGGRRSNVLSMQWGEIDFRSRLWHIPPDKSKHGEEMLVPLSDEATNILERRKKSSSSIFVFASSKSKTGHLVEPRRSWQDLLKRAEIEDLRLHDLRRTLGSYQTITGASTAIVGKTLGHKSPEATAVYARLNLDPIRSSVETATSTMLAMKEIPDKIVKVSKKK